MNDQIKEIGEDAAALPASLDYHGRFFIVNNRMYFSRKRIVADNFNGVYKVVVQSCWELSDLNYNPLGVFIVK